MSKTIKRKITVELPKVKDLSCKKSVFERLGNKKKSNNSVSIEIHQEEGKRLLSTVIVTTKNDSKPEGWDQSKLEDEDPDILEQRREALQKELELQLKMESPKKLLLKKHKQQQPRPRSSSSSGSSSSSDSGSNSSSDDSSSTSSSSSPESRRKNHKKKRDSSSSSDEPRMKKANKGKYGAMKKTVGGKKLSHLKKISGHGLKIRKTSHTPPIKTIRTGSPGGAIKMLHKGQVKTVKMPVNDRKKQQQHYQQPISKERLRDKEKEREKERELQQREREREKEKERERLRLREKERGRSRTPKGRSPRRSPPRSRELKKKTPEKRLTPIKSRTMSGQRRSPDRRSNIKDTPRKHENSRDRERRERDMQRQEREALRNKGREEALARCQERQRERERIAKERERRAAGGGLEKPDRGKPIERLLPRPAERERAIAIAAGRSGSSDKLRDSSHDRTRSHSHSKSGRDRHENDRGYDGRPPPDRTGGYERHDRRIPIGDEREFLVTRNRDGGSPYEGGGRRREEYMEPMEKRYDEHEDRRLAHEYSGRDVHQQRHEREHNEWDRDHEPVRDPGRIYDRPPEHQWDRNDGPPPHGQEIYNEPREWQPERQWEDGGEWKRENDGGEEWNSFNDREWVDRGGGHREQHENGGGNNRRWVDWGHGGTKEEPPHVDYRRPGPQMMSQQDIGEGRGGEMYPRRHPHQQNDMHSGPYHHKGPRMHMNQEYRPKAGFPNIVKRNFPVKVEIVPETPITSTVTPSVILGVPVAILPATTQLPVILPVEKIEPKIEVTTVTPTPTVQPELKSPIAAPIDTLIKEQPLEPLDPIPDDLSEISDDEEILNAEEDEVPVPVDDGNLSKNVSFNQDLFSIDFQSFCPDYEPEIAEPVTETLPLDEIKDNNKEQDTQMESEIVPNTVNGTEQILQNLKDETATAITTTIANNNKDEQIKNEEEMDLDFEEISDGELEEEARVKGLGDALGVDWASLVQESRFIQKDSTLTETTAKQRWQPYRIFFDVGISYKMAGKQFAEEILNNSLEKLKIEEFERRKKLVVVKTEEIFIKKEIIDEQQQQQEDEEVVVPKEEHVVVEEMTDFNEIYNKLNPIACVQVAGRLKSIQRKNLIINASGDFSRGLSARRDLQLRRQLCGFPSKEINNSVGSNIISNSNNRTNNQSSVFNSELAKAAVNLFQRAISKAQ